MAFKRFLMLLVMVVTIFSLVACERPASRAPTGGETLTATTGDFPLPGVTNDVMGQLESFATQTAVALMGGTPESQPTPTSAPSVGEPAAPIPTATSQPEVQAPTATSAAPAEFPLPTSGIPSSYTLEPGEHPYCIARRFNVNPDEMLRLSGLGAGGNYAPGTRLTIPKSGNKFPANRALKAHPTTYTVRSGDTIYTISCDFGDVDPNTLIAANGLKAPYKLSSGQTLKIP